MSQERPREIDFTRLDEILTEREELVWKQLAVLEQQSAPQRRDDEPWEMEWEEANAEELFIQRLEEYGSTLLLIAEGAGFRETATRIGASITALRRRHAKVFEYVLDYDSAISFPWNNFRSIANLLRGALDFDEIGSIRSGRQAVEKILRRTALNLLSKEVVPTKEHEVQREANAVLASVFDLTTTLTIPGPLKSYKPDAGIPSLRTAIEYKFVDSRTQLNTALGGVLEDMTGYEGSEDWNYFFSLIYMTAPFGVEADFAEAMKNKPNWKPILVNGEGGRPNKADRPKKRR